MCWEVKETPYVQEVYGQTYGEDNAYKRTYTHAQDEVAYIDVDWRFRFRFPVPCPVPFPVKFPVPFPLPFPRTEAETEAETEPEPETETEPSIYVNIHDFGLSTRIHLFVRVIFSVCLSTNPSRIAGDRKG